MILRATIIGHGPFSHILDDEVVPRLGLDKKWKHEDGSINMLGDLIEELRNSESITPNIFVFVVDRIVTSLNVDRAINYMIADAFVKANPCLKIKEAIDKPKEYIKLNNSILSFIEHSEGDDLKESRKIIKRIRRRDLYKFIAECLISKVRKKFVTK
ncbi:10421_t:CDS:2, partial [Dentiscutata heterogama]